MKTRTNTEPAAPVNRIASSANGQDKKNKEQLTIAPLRQAIMTIPIVGVSPLKVLRFSQKKRNLMATTQEAGEQSKTKRKREPKDFKAEYEDAKYRCTVTEKGKELTWLGLNANGVRNGCIETCRMAGFVMTRAKMSVFCVEDGLDNIDATPLCRIYGEPEMVVDPVRNANGSPDLRPRVMFRRWKMTLRIRFDEDQFSASDIINLMIRVGQQNGLGEGRPNGTQGCGTGNGIFTVDAENCKLERLPQNPFKVRE